MKLTKPIIKFNGGKPVALCNRCFCMMCYVSCKDEDLDKDGNCVVIERRGTIEGDYISYEWNGDIYCISNYINNQKIKSKYMKIIK